MSHNAVCTRWHQYWTPCLHSLIVQMVTSNNSLFGVSKASLSAAISPPFFSAMMDQWPDNQADGFSAARQASFPTILTLCWSLLPVQSQGSLVYHSSKGQLELCVPSLAGQWFYEIYAGVTFSMENAHIAASTVNWSHARGEKKLAELGRSTHSHERGVGDRVKCVLHELFAISPTSHFFISLIQFQGEGWDPRQLWQNCWSLVIKLFCVARPAQMIFYTLL